MIEHIALCGGGFNYANMHCAESDVEHFMLQNKCEQFIAFIYYAT